MKDKKAGARQRADDFLAAIGTAGGPIGAPGLVQFGAGDTARQVQAGNIDEYAFARAQDTDPKVGEADNPIPPMPRDLDNSYLKLNLPGSPLPRNGLLAPGMLSTAEMVQNQINTSNQYELMKNMRPTGQLMLGALPQSYDKGKK